MRHAFSVTADALSHHLKTLKTFAYADNWQCLVMETTWKSFDPRRHSVDAKYHMLQTCEIRVLHIFATPAPLNYGVRNMFASWVDKSDDE